MIDDSIPARAKNPVAAMEEALQALRDATAPAAERVRRASCAIIDDAAVHARAARRVSGSMPAVRPGKPSTENTERYIALRDAAVTGLPVPDGGLRT
jgi:hypothetical protein